MNAIIFNTKNNNTLSALGKVYIFTSSDNDYWAVEKNNEYVSLEFSNVSFTGGATIDSVTVYCEHYEESGFGSGELIWKIGKDWPSSPAVWDTNSSVPIRSSDTVDSWDVTSVVDTPAEVNDLEFYIENAGSDKKTFQDHVYVIVEWSE